MGSVFTRSQKYEYPEQASAVELQSVVSDEFFERSQNSQVMSFPNGAANSWSGGFPPPNHDGALQWQQGGFQDGRAEDNSGEWPSTLILRAEDSEFPIKGKFAVVLKDDLKKSLQGNTLALPCTKETLGHFMNVMKALVTYPPDADGINESWTLYWKVYNPVLPYQDLRNMILKYMKEEHHHLWSESFPSGCFSEHYHW